MSMTPSDGGDDVNSATETRPDDGGETIDALTRRGGTSDEDDDLLSGVLGMSMLLTDTLTLRQLLTQVAEFAVGAIPGADGAGVIMTAPDRRDTTVASAEFVGHVDAAQYELEQGPCITAVDQRRTVRSGALAEDQSWPRFGTRAQHLGVHSALSLPLMLADTAVGAINVYAHDRDAFTEDAQRIGELFAAPAAAAAHNALALDRARTQVEQLQTALTSRAVIDQALGILISRTGGTAEEAFARLRTLSQNENTKLAAIAQRMVDEAVRRVRARHVGPRS